MNPTLGTVMTISVTVIAAVLVLVLIFLIPVLFQVRRTAREAEKLIDSVRVQLSPLSRDIGFISRAVRSIVQSVHRQVDEIEDGIQTVHDMAIRAREFQVEVQRRVEQPLLEVAAVLAGIRRGIEAVARVFCR
jgi:uncharacterized protein YoxC